jgi:hypothetical protein
MAPRNVRNFWIEGSVDGLKKDISTGPKSANGGFHLTISMRENGEISDMRVHIRGQVIGDELVIQGWVEGSDNSGEIKLETKR